MPMLNWMGREKTTETDKNIAMKILLEDKSLSYDTGDNILGQGDNRAPRIRAWDGSGERRGKMNDLCCKVSWPHEEERCQNLI